MYRKSVLFGLILNLLTACKPGTSKDMSSASFDQLHRELMDLHDSSMVQHGISLRLIDQVILKKTISAGQQAGSLDSIESELDQTNEAMMDWMAEFTDPVSRDSAAISYLKDQIGRMKEITQKQISAITGAQKILDPKK